MKEDTVIKNLMHYIDKNKNNYFISNYKHFVLKYVIDFFDECESNITILKDFNVAQNYNTISEVLEYYIFGLMYNEKNNKYGYLERNITCEKYYDTKNFDFEKEMLALWEDIIWFNKRNDLIQLLKIKKTIFSNIRFQNLIENTLNFYIDCLENNYVKKNDILIVYGGENINGCHYTISLVLDVIKWDKYKIFEILPYNTGYRISTIEKGVVDIEKTNKINKTIKLNPQIKENIQILKNIVLSISNINLNIFKDINIKKI